MAFASRLSPRRLAAAGLVIAVVASVVACDRLNEPVDPPTTSPSDDMTIGVLQPLPVGLADPEAARLASAAAAAYVNQRPEALWVGPADVFIELDVIASLGWHYVSYDRTYQALPVVGGDFVIVVNPAGAVELASVGQTYKIDAVPTTPGLTVDQAQSIAAAELTSVSAVDDAHLAVYALGPEPALAWEFTITGTRAGGDSMLKVWVDANTGAVLDTLEGVFTDQGWGYYNGPSPVEIIGGGWDTLYAMYDNFGGTGMACGRYRYPSERVFTGPDPRWGDGSRENLETQCVDAMFAAGQHLQMLGGMLGRNGVDGEGHMPPMYVDWSWQNAGYIPVSSMPVDPFDAVAEPVPGRLAFGEVSNEPLTSLDVVGHELGHGMDRYTPGGSSNFWVAEFVADIFGVATEWYANQAPPYDTPDWTILDSVLNSPRLRRMDDPASSTPPMATCYDRLAANFPGDIHLAAGPGDHWFYLLAEGTNAATCNGSAVGAIGFWPAFQIFYHAMLLKTTRSSYPAYRAWTAAAARNLFGCEAERAVLRAWDAVAVPNSYASPLVQVATPICGLNQ